MVKYTVQVEDRTFTVEVKEGTIAIDDQVHSVDLRHIEPLPLYSLLIDNLSHEVFIEKNQDRYAAMIDGKQYNVIVEDEKARERNTLAIDRPVSGGEVSIKSPMPGLVLEVRATAGEAVQAGDVLVILESMKMETDIRCPQDGTIQAVHVTAQDHVAQDQIMVTVSS